MFWEELKKFLLLNLNDYPNININFPIIFFLLCLTVALSAMFFIINKKNMYTVYLSRSTDNGKTFTEPQPTGWDGMPAHIFVTSKNEVVLSYGVRTMPMGVRVRISRDNGYTWGKEIVLRDDGLDWDLGYPTTAENAKGELVTVYYMKDKDSLNENRINYTIWTLK